MPFDRCAYRIEGRGPDAGRTLHYIDHGDRSARPVLLCHGDQDPVVPYASLQAAVSGLAAHDVPAQWHTSPGVGHGIDPGALEAASRFLVNAFKEAARAAS